MQWRTAVGKGMHWLWRQDFIVLLSALLIVLAGWGFIELADEISEKDSRATDRRLVLLMRTEGDPGDPIGPIWFEEAVRDVTALGSGVVLALISAAVAGFLALRRKYHAVALLAAALVGGAFLNWMLKDHFERPRPDFVPHLLRISSPSFPSGHALLAAVVYLTLGALLTRVVQEMRLKIYILAVAAIFTVLIGLSRVYLGVHYPTDVLAGWAVGLAWALLCWLAARKLQRRGAIEKPG